MTSMYEYSLQHPKKIGQWGDWIYTPHDFALNLVIGNYTVDEPFYYIFLNELHNYRHLYSWVTHLAGKNLDVYGKDVALDLMHAFDEILRVYTKENHLSRAQLEWDGQALAKCFSKYIRKHRRGDISKSLRMDILNRDNYTCQTCGAKAPEVKLHIDHKNPRSKGGLTTESNLWVMCEACNLGKSDKILNLPH